MWLLIHAGIKVVVNWTYRQASNIKRALVGTWITHNLQVTTGLTHWDRVTHICVSKLTNIGSDNGLSPGRRQAIIWTNARILLIGSLGTNFSEVLIEIYSFSFRKIHYKMSSWIHFHVNCYWCLNSKVSRRANNTNLPVNVRTGLLLISYLGATKAPCTHTDMGKNWFSHHSTRSFPSAAWW